MAATTGAACGAEGGCKMPRNYSTGPFIESPYAHNDNGAWGAFHSVMLNLAAPDVSGAILRTTHQVGASYVLPYRYNWVYDVIFGYEKWVAAGGSADPLLTLDVVVEGANGSAVTGANYGATAGDPFANPTTDFASLITANCNAFGTSNPSLSNVAYAAATTFNQAFFSSRDTNLIYPVGADRALEQGINPLKWQKIDLNSRTNEVMYPVLLQGQQLNFRLATAAGGAGNTVTNLFARVILCGSDTPFDQT